MIFKVIDNNRDIGNIFSDVFSKTSKIKYDDSFKQQIQQDEKALNEYQQKINSGVTNTKKLQKALAGASTEARVFAETGLRAGQSVESFVVNQKQAQIATAAQNKSLSNVRALINTYNSDTSEERLGLEQQQFAEGVAQSNPILGAYFTKVDSGKATMGGYIRSLVAAKAATLALKVATTALNMGITVLVSMGISALINGIMQASEAEKKAIENAVSSADDLKQSLDDIDSYKSKIEELKKSLNDDTLSQSEATEKRKELISIQEELIEKYGSEKEVVDSVTEAIRGETNALDELKKISAAEWLKNNQSAIVSTNGFFNDTQEFSIAENNADGIDYHDLSEFLTSQGISLPTIVLGKNGYNVNGKFLKSNISFVGKRNDIVSDYDTLYDAVNEYIKSGTLSKKDVEAWEDFLNKLSDARKYIVENEDKAYQNKQEILKTQVESAIAVNDTYSEAYNKLQEAKERYNQALSENDLTKITEAYKNYQDVFNSLGVDSFNVDEQQVRHEDIIDYFYGLLKELNELAADTPIIVDIQAELETQDSPTNKLKNIFDEKDLKYEDLLEIQSKAELNPLDLNANEQNIWRNIDAYVKTYNDVAKYTNTAAITTEDYINALLKLGIVQQKVAANGETANILSEEQSEELKTIYSDIDKLNEAYQNLCNGDLKDSDVAELIDMFPTLGKYVDWTDEKFGNLAEGIDKVISERPQELIEQLEAIDMSNMSEDEKSAIQSLISYLQTLKTELKDTKTSIENIQTALSGVSGSIETLIGFKKEISDNGYLSKSSIDTILTDDTYIPIRPYIDDTDGMKSAIDSYISTQKEAYKSLYNNVFYKSDTAAYTKEVKKKEKTNKDYLQDAIKDIENQTAVIEQLYGVDLANWGKISETKQAILQNTNAELLAKQNSLINDFAKYYNTDLKNYKNIAEAKAAILENFRTSEAFTKARSVLLEDPTKSGVNFDRVEGKRILYAADEVRKEINSILSSSGLTYDDFEQYMINDTFTSKGNKQLEENLSQIVQAYQIDTKQWDNMLADVLSDGDTTISSDNGNTGDVDESKASEYIDWIERRLKKFAQNTKEVFSKVKDYITFTSQNSQLRKAINAIIAIHKISLTP